MALTDFGILPDISYGMKNANGTTGVADGLLHIKYVWTVRRS